MTPKEQAQELIKRFTITETPSGFAVDLPHWLPKACALIAVDTIIKDVTGDFVIEYDFWNDIKIEIENL